jgi:hypothetical protein
MPFRDALRKRLFEAKDDMRRLDRIADELVKAAEAGNLIAIKEIADRIDGKAVPGSVEDSEHPSVTGYREFFEWMTLLRATPPGHSPSPSINGSCDEQKSSPTDEPEKQDTR